MDFKLGEQQAEALELVKNFISNSSQPVFVIKGSAGTGKSLLINYILKYLKDIYNNNDICLCAPTHKAALVIQRYTNRNAITLHSLLAMSPKVDILELDFKELEFNSGEKQCFPDNGVVICDEASMIQNDLYDFLLETCQTYNTKLICCMDVCQLQPVKQSTKTKIDLIKNSYTLTKIYRQKHESALSDILIDLRNKPYSTFESVHGDLGSIICTSDIKEFLTPAIKIYKEAVKSKDILQTKITAWTNARAENYNRFFHNYIFQKNVEYNQYEFITCSANFTRNKTEYWNSMDYIIVEEPKQIDIEIPEYGTVPGFELALYDDLTKKTNYIEVISKVFDDWNYLAACIEELRTSAILCKNNRYKGKLWGKYYTTLNSFTSPKDLFYEDRLINKKSFTYGYASTTHRLQGSSLETIFVDMKDIFKQKNQEELRQLQYVALSRTRKDAYVFI